MPIHRAAARRAGPEVGKVQQSQSSEKPDPRDSLTPKQRDVMRLLARGPTIADAARASKVNEERAKRWAMTPSFPTPLRRNVPTHLLHKTDS